MADHRTTRTRAWLTTGIVAGLGAVLGLSSPGREPVTAPPAVPALVHLPDSLVFDVQYAGLGAEGVDLVWRGRVALPVPAQVTIRMEYAGRPTEREQPVWPVNAWLFYSANDLRSSFAAELSGSMSWSTGEMRVIGLVSEGLGGGTALEQRMRVTRPGLAGRVTVRLWNRAALGRRPGISFATPLVRSDYAEDPCAHSPWPDSPCSRSAASSCSAG
ncbi:MAG TPA: hypothetical protein VFZ26_13425 [Gemmatimonadales bacterium]